MPRFPSLPRPDKLVSRFVDAVAPALANVATLGEYSNPGSVRSYLGEQKKAFAINSPQDVFMAALMATGRAPVGVGGQKFPRLPLSDEFDSAARTMRARIERDRLIKQMQAVTGPGSLYRAEGNMRGELTPMQKTLLRQLKFDPTRRVGNPGFRFVPPRKFNQDPSTAGMTSALGYTVGDPMFELLGLLGVAHRPTSQIIARLGESAGTSKLSGGVMPFQATAEQLFPLFSRNPNRTYDYSLPPGNLGAEVFTKYLADLLQGKFRDTGPPPR